MRRILLVLFVLMSGCDSNNQTLRDGIYKGVLTVLTSSGRQTLERTLVIKGKRFFCFEDSNSIDSGSEGKYSFDKHTIVFEDLGHSEGEIDQNMLLDGSYSYHFDGKKLMIFAKKYRFLYFKYQFIKQEEV